MKLESKIFASGSDKGGSESDAGGFNDDDRPF